MRRRTVLSMEQALSLSYGTLRFVELGWRVIRLEATPTGKTLPGDPNRYVGRRIAEPDRRSYFLAPNVGKEAIALNLKDPRGQELLRRLLAALPVDVFCVNTLPCRYRALGIDPETLLRAKPDLIWAGISAMGPEHPDVPGYDPALQALVGYMELTGDPEGPPMLMGVPAIDLKAGDELFAQVCLALLEREETGRGKVIHVSMFQAAASWLLTTLPLLDLGGDPADITRAGNEHRQFVPVNVYPTGDGHIFIAVGNDHQWRRLTELAPFASLARPERATNAGRKEDRRAIHAEMAAVTRRFTVAALCELLARAGVPHAPVNTIPAVADHPGLASKLRRTRLPDGRTVRLPPPAMASPAELPLAPRYGEHTAAILREAGLTEGEVAYLAAEGVVWGLPP